jgi:hypothetical protein
MELRGWFEKRTITSDLPDPAFNSVEGHPEPIFTPVFFPTSLLGVLLFNLEGIPTMTLPRSYRKAGVHSPPAALKALLKSLETWAELVISADFSESSKCALVATTLLSCCYFRYVQLISLSGGCRRDRRLRRGNRLPF